MIMIFLLLLAFLIIPHIFFQRYIKIKYFDIQQFLLKHSVLFCDEFSRLKYVGGVDISFVKNDNVNACVSLVVIEIETLQTVLAHSELIKINCEYIPGYLAFRETPHILNILNIVKKNSPTYYPDILLVDGNGRLHKKEFGLACQTGVVCNLPCIGAAKNLYQMECCIRDQNHKDAISNLALPGSSFDIVNIAGNIIGCAMKTTRGSSKPIYISEGHKICLETAKEVVFKCSKYRVPEPIRLADILSRKILRDIEENK